jgi:hypothetical protein
VAPAPFVLATSAAGLGFVYSSGAALRVADLLDGDSPVELHVPVFLRWVAAGFAVGVGLGLLALLFALWWVSRVPEGDAWRVAEDYRVPRSRGPDWLERLRDDYRVRRIVHARRLQRAVQVRAIFRVLVGLALLSMIVAAAALSYVALGWSVGPGPATWGDRLASAGGWAVTGVVVGLVVVAVAGWRSEAWRRRIGILWDVLSFWPRGAHPLAPPSYTERAVPQLVARICHLARAGTRSPRAPRVVLSGHSQGAVISAAVVAQLDVLDRGLPEGERVLPWVALLTHGAPLGRLYEPLFPQVFGADALSAVRDALDRRWVNLWRDTDPIASQLSRLLDRRDRRCRDPAGFDLDGETGRYPPIRAHSDYPADPAYATARRDLLGDRGPAAEAATRIELPGAVQPGGRPAVPAPTPSPAPSR